MKQLIIVYLHVKEHRKLGQVAERCNVTVKETDWKGVVPEELTRLFPDKVEKDKEKLSLLQLLEVKTQDSQTDEEVLWKVLKENVV